MFPSLRTVLILFLTGWLLWFWIDKSAPIYRVLNQIPAGDDLLRDFQSGFELVKQGDLAPAYVFLWREHTIVMTLLLVLLVALVTGMARRAVALGARLWGARRRRPDG